MRALPTERTPVRRQVGFVVVLVALTVFLIGASAPSPFYPVLQERIGFSSVTMTLIFAVYAVSMLVTLLLTGSLSDHLGRRPVMTAGLLVLAVSMTAFWQAESVGLLITARIVQGFGAGLLMSSMSAAVVDLEPVSHPGWGAIANSVTPLAGLAAGGLIAGLVLEYVDEDPFTAIFGVLTATSPHCARWRNAWSINTSASIDSAIGVARMPTHGSCRPNVSTTAGCPALSIERRGVRMLEVGLIAIDTVMSCPVEIPPSTPPA